MTPQEHLTPREIQVAVLVWEGLTNREIGRIIGTS
ncbi:MAG: LuxR C-terminal-related transcriptional regulator [Candidatus Sulfotelmatobacter sp.]